MPSGRSAKADGMMTARELEFVRLSAQGCTTNEIGDQIDRSPKTVQKTLDRVIQRLKVRNRAHLIAVSVARGWVDGEHVLKDYEEYKASLPDDE